MNILYLTDDEITSGGAVKEHVNAICIGFKKRNHSVTLVCPSVAAGISLSVDQIITYGKESSIFRAFKMIKTIRNILNEVKFDAIYIRYRASQLPLIFLSTFTKHHRFIEINGIAEKEMQVSKIKSTLIQLVQRALEKNFFCSSSGIFSVTKEISHFYQKKHHINEKNIYVFNNGVWPEKFEFKSEQRQKRETVKLGFVGNLAWWQGLETVINAVGSEDYINKVELTIIGTGDQLVKLKKIASNKANNIHFIGQVPSDNIPEKIMEFDIGLVSKSIKGEGLSPIKLYEYWAGGLPVIATHLPGLDTVKIINGGLTYELDDVNSFRKTLDSLLNNRDKWQIYGENGRKYVEEFANWNKIGQSTVEIIEDKCGIS